MTEKWSKNGLKIGEDYNEKLQKYEKNFNTKLD